MNIVIWTASYLPNIGGMQISTARLCGALRSLGNTVTVVTRGATEDISGSFGKEVYISAPDVREWTKKSGEWILEMVGNVDVVHCIDLFYDSIDLQLDYLKKFNKPNMVKIPTAGCLERIIKGSLTNSFQEDIDCFIALNEAIITELKSLSINESKICYLPNGIDTSMYQPVEDVEKSILRRKLSLPEDKKIILYVGRLVERKRTDVLMAVAEKLPQNAVLVVLGSSGNDHDAVKDKNLSKNQNIIYRNETLDSLPYLLASDIHILLSEREGMPNSVLESMAAGLPTIGTSIPGITDLIDNGKDGYLVKVGEVEETLKAVNSLLESDSLRREMGKRARVKSVSSYDIKSIASRYIEVYKELTRRRNENCLSHTL